MTTITTYPGKQTPGAGHLNAVGRRTVAAAARPARTFGATMGLAIAVTTLAFLLGVGIPYALHTDSFMSGLGLGAFSAFWGGPGFGTMAGFTMWTHQQDQPNEARDHA